MKLKLTGNMKTVLQALDEYEGHIFSSNAVQDLRTVRALRKRELIQPTTIKYRGDKWQAHELTTLGQVVMRRIKENPTDNEFIVRRTEDV